jgi:ubiquinone/menaquinone biosynthesis C-methylase UbiE
MTSKENSYTRMQKSQYDQEASSWTTQYRDPVVGSFDQHNAWTDYEYLFSSIPRETWTELDVLDFATGPGRNLVLYHDRFRSIDGVDISHINLANAKKWIENNGLDVNKFQLYSCNGVDLDQVPDVRYDVVMSTIAMQHICVHNIRYQYLKEFFRVLRPGGWVTLQMGFGSPSPATVPYHANFYEAHGTNRLCDVAIAHPSEVEHDLLSIGFKDFHYTLRPTGPGDFHPQWIFFNARKP